MRTWLTLLALGVAVAALALWLFQEAPQHEGERASYELTTLKAAAVSHVKLSRRISGESSERAELELEKREGQWRITAPFQARADAFPVERLLAIVEARSQVRYPAADLARFGLDSPFVIMSVDGATIAYGAINKTTSEQYVMSGDQVLVVPLSYAAALPRNADALLSKALFGPDEMQPVRFDLPEFTVALEDGTWAVAPIASDAGADERNSWIDAWKHATALSVSRHAEALPQETVKVTLKDGRTIALGIAARAPDVVLVREDEGVTYQFFGDAGRKLLLPPQPAPASAAAAAK